MANDLTFFDSNAGLPAHIAKLFGGTNVNADLMGGIGAGFPVLSYKGKTWAVVEGGNRTPLLNSDGDARSSLELVILAANPGMSKIFYKGGYVEGSADKPDCYSHDGITPAPDAQAPQCNKCAICPMNQWGTRMTENGSKGKACADAKRLAVAAPTELDKAYLLRVPAASLKDLRGYGEQLARRQAPVSAVVTKVSFDTALAHPKFVFKPVRFLTADEAAVVLDMQQSDTVRQIIGLDHVPEPGENPGQSEVDALEGEPPAAMRTAAPAAAARPAVRPVARAATRAAPARAASVTPTPKVTPDDVDAALAGTTVQPKEPPPAAAAAPVEAPKPQPLGGSTAAATLADIEQGIDDVLASLDD